MSELWRRHWLDGLAQDLRFALRMMRKNPAFTLVAVLTLGLGIGANTAIFSLLEVVLLRPLPYPEPERLFMLWTVEAKSQSGMNSSYPDYRDWREQNHVFERLAAFHGTHYNLTGPPEPERVDALRVAPGLFELLRVQPVLGRTLSPEDDRRVVCSVTHSGCGASEGARASWERRSTWTARLTPCSVCCRPIFIFRRNASVASRNSSFR